MCDDRSYAMGSASPDRAVSPVIGVVLMVVLTLLLASSLTFLFSVDMEGEMADDIVEGDVEDDEAADEGTESEDELRSDLVVAENETPGATGVVHSSVVGVEGAAETTLDEITVDYPKSAVDLETQSHDEILTLGVDTDADGTIERTFDSSDVSGVNTNDDDSVLTVTLDTGYTLSDGDRVKIRYGGADNPDAAGEYDVSVTINGAQSESGTLRVG